MGSRRLDLSSVKGLLGSGMLAGALFGSTSTALHLIHRPAELDFGLLDRLSRLAAPSTPAALFVPSTLRERELALPVHGVAGASLVDTFLDARSGSRVHQAIDIPAPRHTPVYAVDDGQITRLTSTPRGGISIYQRDLTERYTYFYAHLQAYAAGLSEGQHVRKGEAIGYVGTSGNAPENAPHLHFAIYESDGRGQQWAGGRPINPFPLLAR